MRKLTALAYINIRTVLSMKECGKKIFNMAKEKKNLKMALIMKVNIRRAKCTDEDE